MSKILLFRRAIATIVILALTISFIPVCANAQESVSAVSFSIDGETYNVDMKFEGDQLYCRVDQWAEVASCMWTFNSEQQKVLFYYDTPVVLASYDDQTYVTDGSNMWVPFFNAATQTGVYFSEVSGRTVCGYKVKPLAVFYNDMDRMFATSKYRTTEMIVDLGGVWALISSSARAYAILSSLSLSGFLDAVSGKMDQDMYDKVLIDILKTDETLLGAITETGNALKRPGKVVNLLQKSLEEDGVLVNLLEQMDFSESDIRDVVWDLSKEVYGSKPLNDLSDFYEADKTAHFLEMLELIDDMTVSLEADTHTVMAMQEVFGNSDSLHIRHAAEKAIGARIGNKALSAGMYSLEYLGDVLFDKAIGKLEDAYEKSAGVTSLEKLAAEALVWAFDESLSLTDKSNAVMYSEVYSQVQMELVSYYYKHRDDNTPQNALMMHSVALLYLRTCLSAWQMFEFDESLSQAIDNAKAIIAAEITSLTKYTEEELLQNGTTEKTVHDIIELTKPSVQRHDGLIDYLGKDISDVVGTFGSGYIDEYIAGGHCYTYDDLGAVFFFEDANGKGTTVHTIFGVGRANFGYGFYAQMTYPEILDAVAQYTDIDIGKPEGFENLESGRYEYSLQFTISEAIFGYRWAEDPYHSKSESLSVILPSIQYADYEQQPSPLETSCEENLAYKQVIKEYSDSAEYALYDIDKDGLNELIVRESEDNHYIYTYDNDVQQCGDYSWWYSPFCLYEYDGNGLIVHDGGFGSLHLEYVYLYTLADGYLRETDILIGTEMNSIAELNTFLDVCTPIDDFLPVTDTSLLDG